MATELQILKHAKNYIDSLSNGVDPISGRPVPGDAALNQLRLKKCFAYVSTILQRAAEAEEAGAKAGKSGADLKVLKHAKGYIDSLSNGVDPLNRQPVPEESALNQMKLKKCFSYVSGVLQKAVEAEEAGPAPVMPSAPAAYAAPSAPAAETAPMAKPLEEEPDAAALLAEAGFPEGLEVSPETLPLNQAVYRINIQLESAGVKRTAWMLVNQWMKQEGLLVRSVDNQRWVPSPEAEAEGFFQPPEDSEDKGVSCTEQGQRYLCTHLAEILDYGQKLWDRLLESFTPERLSSLRCSGTPLTITQVAENLNTLLPPDAERKINAVNLSDWLEMEGYLKRQMQSGTKTLRIPSEAGETVGVRCKSTSQRTPVYDESAQRFLFSHVPEVVAFNRRLRLPPKTPAFYVPAGLDFRYSEQPIGFKIFQKNLNQAIAKCGGVPLMEGAVAVWLAQEGYLENRRREDGATIRMPNEQGTAIGLEVGRHNGLEFTVCSESAQRFLIRHLDSIGELQNQVMNPIQNTN